MQQIKTMHVKHLWHNCSCHGF